jgi:hypothetical protein
MADWITKLDAFLAFNEYDILQDAGKVRMKVAKELAAKQYSDYRKLQDERYQSDFDKLLDETVTTLQEE